MGQPVSFELHVSPDSVSRWKIGRDGVISAPPCQGDPVPLSYLVFLRAQPACGLNFHERLGRDPDRGLYGGVAYRRLEPLVVGQRIDAIGDVRDRNAVTTRRGEMAITTFLTEYRADGLLIATEAVRMVDLAGSDNAAASSGSKAATPVLPGAGQPVASKLPIEAADGPVIATIAPISRAQVAWTTVETGDINPLHLDAAYASRRGFSDVVVPATLLNALIERELSSVFGGALVALDIRYQAPTFPDEAIVLRGLRNGHRIAFRAWADGTKRAEGSAERKRPL